jgi:SAM-dependent methyltransferase
LAQNDAPDSVVQSFDPNTPNVARIYDYLLGGKDHFAADRDAARKILRVVPEAALAARENRAFLGRAVRYAAEAGISQFLDIGVGLPAQESVLEIAGRVRGDARVVYVDHDQVVLVHARALLAGGGNATVVPGDLRRPKQIVDHPALNRAIDFGKPVAVLLTAVLHYLTDADDPARVLATLRGTLAPGSLLVLSHAVPDARTAALGGDVFPQANSPLTLRPREEVEAMFDGFQLIDPGLTWVSKWRPRQAARSFAVDPALTLLLGGVGRKA